MGPGEAAGAIHAANLATGGALKPLSDVGARQFVDLLLAEERLEPL
jgi:hypothetical protein